MKPPKQINYATAFADYLGPEGAIDIRKWVPDGLVHLQGHMANQHILHYLNVPFVRALVGFKIKDGVTEPKLHGCLIHEEDYPKVEVYRDETAAHVLKKSLHRSRQAEKTGTAPRGLSRLLSGSEEASRVFIDGPTSSGKTYTALQMAKQYTFVGVAVPIKALAYEIFIRLCRDGYRCHLHTGDCHFTHAVDPTFVVGTYECLYEIKDNFELLIVDEVHWLDDRERGGMVARLLSHPNLIVMSASIEPLVGFEVISLEAKSKLIFHEDEEYEFKPGDVVLEFCNSVADCMENAEDIEVPKRYRPAYTPTAIKNVYNGGLTPTERLLVQDMFVRGDFHYLYATDAAAQGINLPANVVIIPEVNYKGEPHPDKTLRQMAGRCGRFGQQAVGHVYLKKKPKDQRDAITNLPKFEEQTLGDVLQGRVPPCFIGADMKTEVRGAEIDNAIALASHPVRYYTYSDFRRYQYEFSFLNRIKDQLKPRFREYIVQNRQLFLDTFSPLQMIELLVKN